MTLGHFVNDRETTPNCISGRLATLIHENCSLIRHIISKETLQQIIFLSLFLFCIACFLFNLYLMKKEADSPSCG